MAPEGEILPIKSNRQITNIIVLWLLHGSPFFLQKKTFHVGTLLGILFNIKEAILKKLTFPFFALIIIFFSDFGCTFIYKQCLLSARVPAQDVLVNIVSY